MTEPTLERAVVQYAGYWFRKERIFVEALRSSDRHVRFQALRRAAGYFRIARNLPKAYDVARGLERLEPVLRLLDAPAFQRVSATTLSTAVQSFRHELGAAYGGKDLLSAATKFLWIGHRHSVIIFDSQARAALDTPAADYDAFLHRWRKGYASCAGVIRETCKAHMAEGRLPAHITAVAGSDLAVMEREWFWRRVYDIHLWNLGAPKR